MQVFDHKHQPEVVDLDPSKILKRSQKIVHGWEMLGGGCPWPRHSSLGNLSAPTPNNGEDRMRALAAYGSIHPQAC